MSLEDLAEVNDKGLEILEPLAQHDLAIDGVVNLVQPVLFGLLVQLLQGPLEVSLDVIKISLALLSLDVVSVCVGHGQSTSADHDQPCDVNEELEVHQSEGGVDL